MSIRVDPNLILKLNKFGAFDINGCFNCGNCTAVCPLSIENDSFPRQMIRYAQVGIRNRLISSKELWLCYYCGSCSDTCPRQAEPGEFMASARRYAIASFDPTGISRLLYTSKLFTIVFMAILSLVLALFLLCKSGPIQISSLALFQFIPFEIIHDLGIGVIIIAVIASIVGITRFVMYLLKALSKTHNGKAENQKQNIFKRMITSAIAVIVELSNQKRYRDCEEEQKAPWYLSRWFIHWSIMWGFIGLGGATGMDYLLMIVADKVPGQAVSLLHPTRLLGTIAGLFVLYGTGVAILSRIKKTDKYYSHSILSDWLFLLLLFLTTLTGFIVELAIYFPKSTILGYVIFLFHVVLGMEVVLLLPFTKFAHAVYRPLALFIYNMANTSKR